MGERFGAKGAFLGAIAHAARAALGLDRVRALLRAPDTRGEPVWLELRFDARGELA